MRTASSALLLATFAAVTALAAVAGQALTECTEGERVVDQEGKTGTVVSQGSALCQVKYDDGQSYGWIFWNLRPALEAPSPATAPAAAAPTKLVPGAPEVTVLRPASGHNLTYPAGRNGHVVLGATINGAPVRLLVDTGASLVFLTPDDARAAGFNSSEPDYRELVATGNGTVRAAPVVLRELRIGDLSLGEVRAAVMEKLEQSVLGMSFLGRLKSFEMREGSLTLNW